VIAGGAFVLMEDSCSQYAEAAIGQAGLQTGLDVKFSFETPFRTSDVLVTQCSAGHAVGDGSLAARPISVTKIVYSAHLTDQVRVTVSPIGAQANDMTEIVNTLQGEALTKVSRGGPELYNHCNGPALGASLKGNYALLSISQYLSRWGSGSALSCNSSCLNRPFCLSTLAQLMFEPWENSVFSLSVLNRFWPNGQLPSFMGLHWRDMGPFVLSKTWHAHEQQQPIADSLPRQPPLANSVSRQSFTNSPMFDSPVPKQNSIDRWLGLSGRAIWEDETCAEVESSRLPCAKSFGTTMQSVAFAGKIDVSTNVSLGGWAQVERADWFQKPEKDMQWGISLSRSIGESVDWGLCVGSLKMESWSIDRSEDSIVSGEGITGEGPRMQVELEAFMKLGCGHGLTLQPGVICLLNKHSQTPAFILRSSWTL